VGRLLCPLLTSESTDRVALCKQRIDNLRVNEEFAAVRYEQGSGSLDNKLLATIKRLQAEIDCAREEAKSA
jgi:hypothetical protein